MTGFGSIPSRGRPGRGGCQAYLALITHWGSGAVEYDSLDYVPGWSRRGRSSNNRSLAAANPNAQFVEVSDERLDLTHWFNADGSRSSIKSIVLDESEIVSDIARDKRAYRTEIHEATGNEGVTMERWYRQAAIVIWPRNRYARIMAHEGPRVAVPVLEALLAANASSQDRASAHELVREIVACSLENAARIRYMWRPERQPSRADEPSLAGRMLSALAAIDDATLAMRPGRASPRLFTSSRLIAMSARSTLSSSAGQAWGGTQAEIHKPSDKRTNGTNGAKTNGVAS